MVSQFSNSLALIFLPSTLTNYDTKTFGYYHDAITGLAWWRVGVFTGFDLEAEFKTNPMDPIVSESTFPILFGQCDVCHKLKAMFEATIKEPFLGYSLLGTEETVKPLFGDWSLDFAIAVLCLADVAEPTKSVY